MRQGLLFLFVCALSTSSLAAQVERSTTAPGVLTSVRIATPVLAGGTPLPPGKYEIRLTGEHPTTLVGQPRDAQEWVEFVADGKVVAREIAEIVSDEDLPSEGASAERVQSGTRVEMLKGEEFLRVSVKRERERYLIYLPVRKS